MAKITIGVLTGANVYIDGQGYAGQAEEVTLPDPKALMQDIKALSMWGKVELPHGFDKMMAKIKWNTLSDDIAASSADIFNGQLIMIRSNNALYTNGTKSVDEPVVAFIKGTSKGIPAIGLKHQDKADLETEFTCSYYKLEINGVPVFELDYYGNVFMIDGIKFIVLNHVSL